jgi:NAD(P)H-flavin reductase
VLLIAGGLGVAPLRGALQYLLTHCQEYRRISLLYGARSPDDLICLNELEPTRSLKLIHLGITVDRAGAAWHGRVGVVTQLIASAPFDPAETIAMVCGPEVMMRFTIRELQARGVPEESIFLSLERNMKCAVGLCGHCQLGPEFLCKDGPVFRSDRIKPWLHVKEL